MPQLTSAFSSHTDYIEAKNGSGYVYFGTKKQKPRKGISYNESLKPFYDDIDKHGENSEYIGRVLYPERRGEKWTYEKNKAFWAGIIDSERSLVLVTDIMHYNYPTGTVDELLWLEDNGYRFYPNPDNHLQTIAIPHVPPSKEINDYFCGNGSEGNKNEMLDRLRNIKDHVLALRLQLSQSFKPR